MKKRKPDLSHAVELRRRAEERLQLENPLPEEISPAEAQKLIHELRVHQIELEMQNDELRRAQEILEESRSRYSDLYDFAPIGYLTLDELGIIREANLTAARQLAVERSRLIDRQLTHFMVTEDRGAFRRHLNLVLKARKWQTCELRLKRKDGSEFFALMESAFYQDTAGRSLCKTAFTNITARRQAEADVRESEARYRSLFQHNHAVMLLIDPATADIVDANPAAWAFYGFSREELTARKITDINTLPSQRVFAEMQLAKESERRQFHFRHRLAGGEVRDVEVFSGPIRIKGQELLYSIIHDITARKQAEEALRQSEEHYRSLFNHMLNGLAYCKMLFEQDRPVDFVYLAVNRAFEDLTGLKNVTGKRVSTVIPGLLKSSPELFEIYGKVALSGIPQRFETYIEALGMWYAISVYSPQKEYFVAIFDVITERKRAENIMLARLRLLKFAETHSLDEFTQATLDESEALTASTIGFYHLVEADQRTLSLQSWSTNTLRNMCTAEGKGRHYDIAEAGVWVDCVKQRRPVIHNNYEALPHRKGMPPGHAPVVRELVVPIFRGDKIVAIIGVGNKPSDYHEQDIEVVSLLGDLSLDIAERKRTEEALRRSNEELDQRVRERTAQVVASNEKLRLLASQLLTAQEQERKRIALELHDDLGQSLTVLKLQLRHLERKLSDMPQQQVECNESLNFINEIIEKVRHLSRGLSPPNLDDLGLSAALDHLFNEFGKYKGLKIHVEQDNIKDLFPREAQIGIYRVFQEALNNISKHSGSTRVKVAIKEHGQCVEFSIEDDGQGFFQEELENCEAENRGMGLATMDERVRLLGGVLKLQSKPGQGTRLNFTIPGVNHKL